MGKWPYGKAYIWKGAEIGVARGLGDNCYIVAKKTPGGHKRFISPYLPVCSTPEETQMHLNSFAADHELFEAPND